MEETPPDIGTFAGSVPSKDELQMLNEHLHKAVADRQKAEVQLEAARTALARAQGQLSKARFDMHAAQSNIKARFQELATLTKLLNDAEDISSAAQDQREWLVQLYSAVDKQPWWWSLIPKGWKTRRQHDRLRRMKLFDAQMYLELYPDIAAVGMDPVRHYVQHGMIEGRTCTR